MKEIEKVELCVWSKEPVGGKGMQFLEKVGEAWKSEAQKQELHITNCSIIKIDKLSNLPRYVPRLIFVDSDADFEMTGEYDFEFPCLDFFVAVNKQAIGYKKELLRQIVAEIIPYLKAHYLTIDSRPTIKEKTKVAVETVEGITVGGIGADIEITPDEARHLKEIKDLLGGGKMIITKGDLRIEIGE